MSDPPETTARILDFVNRLKIEIGYNSRRPAPTNIPLTHKRAMYNVTALQSGRPVKYPWDRWLSTARRRPLRLHRGKDYDVETMGLSVTIRQRAEKMGLRVSLSLTEPDTIIIQSVVPRE